MYFVKLTITGLSISLNIVCLQLTYLNVHICVQRALASAQSNAEIHILMNLIHQSMNDHKKSKGTKITYIIRTFFG